VADTLAIVPARGGSKGVARKNIAMVGGKPLIAWTIDAARNAASLSRVVVSTDDPEIARAAREHGADVPFLRPADLARDETPAIDVILDMLDRLYAAEDYQPDVVVCLQPTSPLRTASDIDAAIELLHARDADAVVSLTAAHPHPYWTKRMDANGWVCPFITDVPPPTRRQDLPAAYALNGAVYAARTAVLTATRSWYTARTCGYVMPAERSLDVDTPWDLKLLRLLLQDGSAPTASS
jgi:CMP-N,N'-diacetyllegionaminic acid synthase